MIQNIKEFIEKVNRISSESADYIVSELLFFWNGLKGSKKKKFKDQLPEWFIEVYYNDPGVDFLEMCDWECNLASIYRDTYFKIKSRVFRDLVTNNQDDYSNSIYVGITDIFDKMSELSLSPIGLNLGSVLWKHWLPREHKDGFLLVDEIPSKMSERDFYNFKIRNNLNLDEEFRLYVEHCSPKVRNSIKDCIDPIIPEILENIPPIQIYCSNFNVETLRISCELFKELSEKKLRKLLEDYRCVYGTRYITMFCTALPEATTLVHYLQYLIGDISGSSILYQHLVLWKDLK